MAKDIKVGFIGLGSQGGPMAEMIAKDGWPLAVWARRPEVLQPYKDLGATVAASPFELGQACDVVGICVLNDDDVREVVLRNGEGVLHGMAEGGIIAIHSTVHPNTCIELAEEAAAKGVTLIDAPVSGSGEAALNGTLTVMVGGDPQAFERCRPIFESYGDPVRQLGPIGSGQYCKLVNNILLIANLKVARSALDAAAALKMDEEAVTDILKASSGGSFALDALTRIINPDNAEQVVILLSKDLRLFQEIARPAGLGPSTVENVAQETIEMLEAMRDAAS